MIFLFEISPPVRLVPKLEKAGSMTRLIWLWFSVAYFKGLDVNTLFRHIREDEITKYSSDLAEIFRLIDEEKFQKAKGLIDTLEGKLRPGTHHPELIRARNLIHFLEDED